MLLTNFVLVSHTNRVGMDTLRRVAAAIQRQLIEDLPKAWGFTASIHAVERVEETPAGGAPIIVVDDIPEAPGTYGFHRVLTNDPKRLDDDQPYALVKYAANNVWTIDASHECLEMVVNPMGNTMVRAPSVENDRTVDYMAEICDPCGHAEAAYKIDDVIVSDFVTRAYFNGASGTAGAFSAQGRLAQPRTLQSGGYLAWAEMSDSGELGAGDWYILYSGGNATAIPHPNIYASLREGVDFASHAYVEANAKADRKALLQLIKAENRRKTRRPHPRKSGAAWVKRHLKTLRRCAGKDRTMARALSSGESRPVGEKVHESVLKNLTSSSERQFC